MTIYLKPEFQDSREAVESVIKLIENTAFLAASIPSTSYISLMSFVNVLYRLNNNTGRLQLFLWDALNL